MKRLFGFLSVILLILKVFSNYASASLTVPLNELVSQYTTTVPDLDNIEPGGTQFIAFDDPIFVGGFILEYSGTIKFPLYIGENGNIFEGPATNIFGIRFPNSVTGTGLFLELESYHTNGRDYVLEGNDFQYTWTFNNNYGNADVVDIELFNFFYNGPFMTEFDLDPFQPGIIDVNNAQITFIESTVPLPPAIWLLGSGLIVVVIIKYRKLQEL